MRFASFIFDDTSNEILMILKFRLNYTWCRRGAVVKKTLFLYMFCVLYSKQRQNDVPKSMENVDARIENMRVAADFLSNLRSHLGKGDPWFESV